MFDQTNILSLLSDKIFPSSSYLEAITVTSSYFTNVNVICITKIYTASCRNTKERTFIDKKDYTCLLAICYNVLFNIFNVMLPCVTVRFVEEFLFIFIIILMLRPKNNLVFRATVFKTLGRVGSVF